MPSPDAKYNGAANEISARIQARNRTLMAFFSIAAVLLGVAVRGPESGPQDVKGGSMAIIGGIAIPYLALVMVIISTYHESMIAALMRYQRALAETDQNNRGPEWTAPDFYGQTIGTRNLRNWAPLVLIFIVSVVPVVLLIVRWDDYAEKHRPVYLGAACGGVVFLIGALGLLTWNIWWRTNEHRRTALKR
jgi:hypothetical protein